MATYNSNTTGKEFEKPDTGNFVGVIVDVINGIVRKSKQPPFGEQLKTRIVWLLNAKDSDGNYFRVSREVNPKVSAIPGRRKSSYYEVIESVFGSVPAVFDDETLIGQSSNLYIKKEKGDDGKMYANIKDITSLKPEQTPMAVPAGFVRSKDKVQQPLQRSASVPSAVISTAETETDF